MAINVVLRPPSAAELDRLLEMRQTPEDAGTYQWFGYDSELRLRARIAAGELITETAGIFAVLRDDELLGDVEWFRSTWGRPESSWCWSIAIVLWPQFRGYGVGRAVQRELAEYLFAHSRAERVQAWTDVDNVAEQRALEAAGFAREGILRRAQWRQGAWHDQALYSVLRPGA